jgi:glycosyltransferase involved in cell wall biosynthesis
MNKSIALLHYSAPPVVGGVESVMYAHAQVFLQNGYAVSIIAGSGQAEALPQGAQFIHIPLLDSQHPEILRVSADLELGKVSQSYTQLRKQIKDELSAIFGQFEHIIVHNVFSKHFNLPLTDALHQLLDAGQLNGCIAWCHDLSWASARSLPLLHEGQPWELLRQYRSEMQYVTVSQKRRESMADIFHIPLEEIHVIYNGFNPDLLIGMHAETKTLLQKLDLSQAELLLLMPVRVTQAKNVEFALRALGEIRQKGCAAEIIMTGPPDPHDADNMAYFQTLKELRRELGLEDVFHFVYEIKDPTGHGTTLQMTSFGDLYRTCDALFMPSRREGFGMPILEAGFLGKPIFASNIPAVEEIGQSDMHLVDISAAPANAAQVILDWVKHDPLYHLQRKTRENFTWEQIFHKQIEPLLSLVEKEKEQ